MLLQKNIVHERRTKQMLVEFDLGLAVKKCKQTKVSYDLKVDVKIFVLKSAFLF